MRRRLILEAARVCIAERGLADTTVREIAAAAGVSVGTVTYHFTGIGEILVEVIRESSEAFTADLLAKLPSDAPARTRLELLFDAPLADTEAMRSQWRLWIDYWARAVRDEKLATLHEERYAVWRAAVGRIITEGIAAGEFRAVEAGAVAIELVGLLDGLGLQLMIGDPQVARRDARALMRGAIAARLAAQ